MYAQQELVSITSRIPVHQTKTGFERVVEITIEGVHGKKA